MAPLVEFAGSNDTAISISQITIFVCTLAAALFTVLMWSMCACCSKRKKSNGDAPVTRPTEAPETEGGKSVKEDAAVINLKQTGTPSPGKEKPAPEPPKERAGGQDEEEPDARTASSGMSPPPYLLYDDTVTSKSSNPDATRKETNSKVIELLKAKLTESKLKTTSEPILLPEDKKKQEKTAQEGKKKSGKPPKEDRKRLDKQAPKDERKNKAKSPAPVLLLSEKASKVAVDLRPPRNKEIIKLPSKSNPQQQMSTTGSSADSTRPAQVRSKELATGGSLPRSQVIPRSSSQLAKTAHLPQQKEVPKALQQKEVPKVARKE